MAGPLTPPSTAIRGVRAYITTAPVPDLHGGDFSCAWPMLCYDNGTRWAQCGYTCDSPDPDVLHCFAQWTDNNGNVNEPPHYFSPGSGDHRYTVLWDRATGHWSFQYDDSEFENSGAATNWYGQQIQFFGEVVPNTSVQMMGDVNNKVKFSGMQQYVAPCLQGWMTKWPYIYGNDAPGQWGQDVSEASGYFKIWDSTP